MNTTITVLLLLGVVAGLGVGALDEEQIRKSIIYDKKTPEVFYCPLEERDEREKIVKSRPLKKLCEYAGNTPPEGYRSDCYGDVDETPYACKEKKRIMKRRYPPGMEVLEKYEPVPRWKRAENYIRYRF